MSKRARFCSARWSAMVRWHQRGVIPEDATTSSNCSLHPILSSSARLRNLWNTFAIISFPPGFSRWDTDDAIGYRCPAR
jgi:hypothetical protein